MVFVYFLAMSCSHSANPTNYYYNFFEYPEYQHYFPTLNHGEFYYPQFYWGYYLNPYYRMEIDTEYESQKIKNSHDHKRRNGIRRSR